MKIIFNGQEYDGVERMPPDIRRRYLEVVDMLGDANGDGVPDVLQGPESRAVAVKESIIYNGREYKDRSELPPEARQALEQMPPPKPEEIKTRVELKTKILPPKVTWSVRGAGDAERGHPLWLLVVVLVVILVVVFWLWLSGIRPADLFGR
jgi:hypothetical protein